MVQVGNYKDMVPMVTLADKYNAERLWFNRVTDWNTFKNFQEVDVLDRANSHYDDCIAEIEKIKKLKSNVLVAMPTVLGHE